MLAPKWVEAIRNETMLIENYTDELDEAQGYFWLWRLRWVEAGSLLLGALAAHFVVGIELPWWIVSLVLAALILSNLSASPGRTGIQKRRQAWVHGLLSLDLVLITVLLYFTGGAHNPFTMLYLLLIVLAVILLSPAAAWSLVLLTVLAFGFLFVSPHMLVSHSGDVLCHDMDFHLKGMVLGLGVAGAGVVYFVSSLKRVLSAKHREVEALRRRMAEQGKLVELSAVAATVAHEVATPLGTIAVIGRDMESVDCGAACGAQLREDAGLIRDAVARCHHVLQWLSERAAGPVEDDAQAINAALFYDQLASFLSRAERERVHFRSEEAQPQTVHTSLQELVLSVAILIRNALDASEAGQSVELRWESDAAQVRISVIDTGHGMSQAVLAKIREPFFTTKTPNQGFGLGLYLVSLFCQRQAGELEITSEPGSGTTATLTLPADG